MKLIYVLPLYDPETEQHFAYNYDLLARIDPVVDLAVIIESATAPFVLPRGRVYVQRCHWAPLRALEMLLVMAWFVFSGYDRIYTHYSTFGAAASIVCRFLFGARSFYWNCEENAAHWRRGRLDRAALANKVRIEWPTATVIRLVDALVTGTPSMARYYERVYGLGTRRTRVLPNACDLERFAPRPAPAGLARELGAPEGRPIALFVHRLAPRKGSRELPELIAATPTDLFWLIAGDGPDRVWLEAELVRLGVATRARVLGNVPNRRIADLYRLATLLVMPSRQEGFPRVLLEAMASGIPFVATDVGGVQDVVGPLARRSALVARGDMPALAGRIAALIADPALRRQLVDEGQARVRDFAPEAVAARFLSLFGAGRAQVRPAPGRMPTNR